MSVPTAAMLAAWGAADHTPALLVEVMWDGATWTDETARVLSAGGVDGIDPVTRAWTSSELTLVLSNEDGRFTPTNTSGPFYSYLGHTGQKVRLSLGWNAELIVYGTYWIDTFEPAEAEGIVNLRCLDRLGSLANALASLETDTGELTSVAFSRLCASAGLTATTDYTVETGVETCLMLICSQEALAGQLAQVATAEGGRFIVTADGVIAFWNATHHRAARGSADVTITRSTHVYDAAVRKRTPLDTNRVMLSSQQRTYTASGVVCTVSQLVDLPQPVVGGYVETGGANGGVWCQLEAVDPVTYETGAGAVLGTIASITSKTYPGGVAGSVVNAVPAALVSPSNTVYYQWTPEGQTGILHMWTVSSTDTMQVDVSVNGTLERLAAPVSVVADDLELQAAAGGKVTAVTLDNGYLPVAARAQAVARDLLSELTGSAWVELPDIDGVPFLRAHDCFTYVDDSVSPAVTYTCVVGRHEWSWSEAGYASRLSGLPGLTAQVPQPVAATVGPFASSGIVAADPDVGPWYWGSSAHTGSWGAFDWG